MRKLLFVILSSLLLIPMTVLAENGSSVGSGLKSIKIVNTDSASSSPGPSEYFTGRASITTILNPDDSETLSCASVRFEHGARSAWHYHPKGQLLVVTDGAGLIQESGKPVQRIKKGDVIWTPPNVKHWHGAAPESAMTHTATQEFANGKNVVWLEKVTEKEYKSIRK